MYGLKQASRQWFAKFTAALTNAGFQHSKHDYALFIRNVGNSSIYLLIYVDDILFMGNCDSHVARFKEYLHSTFHIKDLGPPKYFLGIEIARIDKGISLSHRKLYLEIISEAGLSGCRPAVIPIEQNIKLMTCEYDLHSSTSNKDPLLRDSSGYQRNVRKSIYLTMIRPDICYAI